MTEGSVVPLEFAKLDRMRAMPDAPLLPPALGPDRLPWTLPVTKLALRSELESANSVCAPDEAEGGETFDNSCGAAELEVAKICVAEAETTLDNSCSAGELELAMFCVAAATDAKVGVADATELEVAEVCAADATGETLDNNCAAVELKVG